MWRFWVFAAFLALSGCDSAVEEVEPEQLPDLIPLATGDRWVGTTEFTDERDPLPFQGGRDTVWVRSDSIIAGVRRHFVVAPPGFGPLGWYANTEEGVIQGLDFPWLPRLEVGETFEGGGTTIHRLQDVFYALESGEVILAQRYRRRHTLVDNRELPFPEVDTLWTSPTHGFVRLNTAWVSLSDLDVLYRSRWRLLEFLPAPRH